MPNHRRAGWLALLVALLAPTAGSATPLEVSAPLVFAGAAIPVKLLIAGLTLSIALAVVICARKVLWSSSGGGSTFLAALRAGGPLTGCVGGAYPALSMVETIAHIHRTPPFDVLAPAFAEMIFLLGLGALAGAVAVIGHAIVEARSGRGAWRSEPIARTSGT